MFAKDKENLSYMQFYRDNDLFLCETSISLKSIENGNVDTNNVTGISFVFCGDETVNEEILDEAKSLGISDKLAMAVATTTTKFIEMNMENQ